MHRAREQIHYWPRQPQRGCTVHEGREPTPTSDGGNGEGPQDHSVNKDVKPETSNPISIVNPVDFKRGFTPMSVTFR
jgi:hypothetical protein